MAVTILESPAEHLPLSKPVRWRLQSSGGSPTQKVRIGYKIQDVDEGTILYEGSIDDRGQPVTITINHLLRDLLFTQPYSFSFAIDNAFEIGKKIKLIYGELVTDLETCETTDNINEESDEVEVVNSYLNWFDDHNELLGNRPKMLTARPFTYTQFPESGDHITTYNFGKVLGTTVFYEGVRASGAIVTTTTNYPFERGNIVPIDPLLVGFPSDVVYMTVRFRLGSFTIRTYRIKIDRSYGNLGSCGVDDNDRIGSLLPVSLIWLEPIGGWSTLSFTCEESSTTAESLRACVGDQYQNDFEVFEGINVEMFNRNREFTFNVDSRMQLLLEREVDRTKDMFIWLQTISRSKFTYLRLKDLDGNFRLIRCSLDGNSINIRQREDTYLLQIQPTIKLEI